ncbi:hypothetical protein P7F88_19360 [Vibrio hannami]|nr:hypothetical protein [Vibrio hannami]MDG3088115.1 hypothetical protein [Vibrio hannami]
MNVIDGYFEVEKVKAENVEPTKVTNTANPAQSQVEAVQSSQTIKEQDKTKLYAGGALVFIALVLVLMFATRSKS